MAGWLRTLSEGDCVRGVRAASLAAGVGVSPEDSLRDSSFGGQQQRAVRQRESPRETECQGLTDASDPCSC